MPFWPVRNAETYRIMLYGRLAVDVSGLCVVRLRCKYSVTARLPDPRDIHHRI